MVRVGAAIFGVLVALVGYFLPRIADAMNSGALREFADTRIATIPVSWIIAGLGILIFLVGLAAPGPYYGAAYGPGYREERVVEREVPRERVVEGSTGERVVEEPEGREVIRE